jgi:hypothetical protein
MSGMGSLVKEGGCGVLGDAPVLENAPDFWMSRAMAAMPLFVPRISGRVRYLEARAFLRIFRCWLVVS